MAALVAQVMLVTMHLAAMAAPAAGFDPASFICHTGAGDATGLAAPAAADDGAAPTADVPASTKQATCPMCTAAASAVAVLPQQALLALERHATVFRHAVVGMRGIAPQTRPPHSRGPPART